MVSVRVSSLDSGSSRFEGASTFRLKKSRESLTKSIQLLHRKLCKVEAFDSAFWNDAVTIIHLELQRVQIDQDLGEKAFLAAGNTAAAWAESEPFTTLLEHEQLLKDKLQTFHAELSRLESMPVGSESDRAITHSYTSFFLNAPLGADIGGVSAGTRSSSVQSNFHDAVVAAYHMPDDPRDAKDEVWDVFTGRQMPAEAMQAGHFFAWRHGVQSLVAIFGEEAKDDLFSPANGLLLPNIIEQHIDKGIFSLYPSFSDDATEEERLAWQDSEVKEYRLRFFEHPPKPTDPKKPLPIYHRKWAGVPLHVFEARPLIFRSSARPDPRYIFYNFLLNWMRYLWRNKSRAKALMQKEFAKPSWSTIGKYIKQNQLRGFIAQVRRLCEISEAPSSLLSQKSPQDDLPSMQDECIGPAVHFQVRFECDYSEEAEYGQEVEGSFTSGV